MTNGQWFPPEWPERIRALARGELTPAEPRVAATVMLLRDGLSGPEVFLLRRRTTMAFAAGACAYPGGGVDPRDRNRVPWSGPSPREWARTLGVDEATARSVVCAAVRETFEEAGVLLAGPAAPAQDTGGDDAHVADVTGDAAQAVGPAQVVADVGGPEWEAARAALVARELSVAQLLDDHGLSLRSGLLRPWTRWITPEFEPRRYDTWFFVARLPEGQHSRNASTEADRAGWVSPAEAAAAYDSGELTMMPPTITTLRQLAAHHDTDAVLAEAAGRDLTPVLARARVDEAGAVVLSWPGHEEFTRRLTSGGNPA
ncbi:NUDIX hydrolase [Streptomyces sp. NPDC059740]|uniref:NUDIX hydrolase n=1 Tax=Streptomyces sp. NPDC059740 TaxID=3346926 RepID=UPI003667E545